MKKISLLEVSAFVVVAVVASAAVNAGDEITALEKKAINIVEPATLFEPLDIDKNGVITESELGTENNKLLKKQFKKIDKNADNMISQEELTAYLAKVDVKIDL